MYERINLMKKRGIFLLLTIVVSIGLYTFYSFVNQDLDYSKLSVDELMKLAQKEDAEAQVLLGAHFEQGIKVKKNINESLKWNIKSANNGNTTAMVNLGYMYGNGIGVKKDHKKAFEWNLLAAKKGDPSAMFNVGKKYELGAGVEMNKEKSDYWLNQARQKRDHF